MWKTVLKKMTVCILFVVLVGKAPVGGGVEVYFQPESGDAGVVTRTTKHGYFLFDVLSGGKWHLSVNNLNMEIILPDAGIVFIDIPAPPLQGAIMHLREATGLRD